MKIVLPKVPPKNQFQWVERGVKSKAKRHKELGPAVFKKKQPRARYENRRLKCGMIIPDKKIEVVVIKDYGSMLQKLKLRDKYYSN